MGCDIHPIVQVNRNEVPGEYGWRVVAIPPHERDYNFFAWLSGVRNYWVDAGLKSQFPNRGIPFDIEIDECGDTSWPIECALLMSGDDGHSGSWCLLTELKEADTSLLQEYALDILRKWISMGEFLAQLFEIPEGHVRFVWNFDN